MPDNTMIPTPKKHGGQPGNKGNTLPKTGQQNALKHGGYSRLRLPNMPAKLHNVQKVVNGFRAALEAACMDAHGSISLTHASTINACVTNERLARLWAKRLADGYASMKDADVATCTDRIERHTKARDEAVKRLHLDRDKSQDFWDALYGPTSHDEPFTSNGDAIGGSQTAAGVQDDSEAEPAAGAASEATPAAVAGHEGQQPTGE